jgi:putative PEP-CTERM system TPR-repeat lipoprotein
MVAGSRFRLLVLDILLAAALTACSSPTPEQQLADARKALDAGETRTAEIHLKNLLQREPDNVEGRLLLGTVALAGDDAAAAEQALRRALQLGADPLAVQLPLVRALVMQRKFADAIAQLEKGPELTGSNREALLRLEGAARRGAGDLTRAESAYRAAITLDPRSSAARAELADLLLSANRAEEARGLIDAVLADNADYVPALILRGNLQTAARQYAAAEETFRRVVDLERPHAQRSAALPVATGQLVETQLAEGKVEAAGANADAFLAVQPKSPLARYLKAAVEVAMHDLDAAERRLETVVADYPTYWPAQRLLGTINISQNQLGQAAMYLRAAMANNPADTAARLALAELYVRQGNVDGARDLLKADDAAAVSDGLFFAFAGRASRQAGLEQQAAQFFNQSEQQVPRDVGQVVGMSSMYVQAGELDRAVRLLESAAFDDSRSKQVTDYLLAIVQARGGDFKAADATAQRLAEQQPTAAWPLNLRGVLAMASGDLGRARELLTKASQLEPRGTTALLNLARVAVAENKPQDAQGFLERAAAINPDDPMPAIGLAQLALARRDFAGAERALERVPASPRRNLLLGDALAAQNRFDAAVTAYSDAYAVQPTLDLALRAYGAAARAGRSNADAQLVAWSTSHPDDPAANFALGSIALDKSRWDDAIGRFEAVLAANPNHAAAMNNLAWLYGQRGDPRALELAQRAHTADPNNPSISDTLGWLVVKNGKAADALPLLAEAAAAAQQPEVRYHWGVALADTGDSAKALEVLQAALAGAANFDGRQDAERRVAELQKSRP